MNTKRERYLTQYRFSDCVGKITIQEDTSDEMIQNLDMFSLNPHTFIVKKPKK